MIQSVWSFARRNPVVILGVLCVASFFLFGQKLRAEGITIIPQETEVFEWNI